ncbi:MAG: hypothetical protein U0802_15295 [Candidatus Binatia bacterium]
MRHARAPLIGFCDGDDVWFPEKAARQLAVMDADATIGLTFSHSAYLDEDGTPTGQLLVSRCRQPSTRDLVRRNHIGNGSTAIVRRACFAAAGLFDESLASCEDAEMWTRLSVKAPHALRLVPEPLTGYRVRASGQMHTFDAYIAGSRTYLEALPQLRAGYGARDAQGTHLRAAPARAEPQGVLQRRHRPGAPSCWRRCARIARHRRAQRARARHDRGARAGPGAAPRAARCRTAPGGACGAYGRLVGTPRAA